VNIKGELFVLMEQDRVESIEFADMTFSHASLELRRNGQVIRLQHQPALFLSYLLRHSGRVIGKQELGLHLGGRSPRRRRSVNEPKASRPRGPARACC
jgi:DNA-binding response OmpR family regulator